MSEYHVPALLEESIKGLNIDPEGTYIDVTFGGGGHSRRILESLTTGKLIAFDQDKDALSNNIDDKRFKLVNHNFKYMLNFLSYLGIEKVDGIIADLGVSSHHFDEAERGFSFRFNGPLDMRMNQKAERKASDILNNYSLEELTKIFRTYGEIKNAYKLSKVVISKREKVDFNEINDFVSRIESCIPKNAENKYLAKVFQALRIEVNNEMDVLKDFLTQTSGLIKGGGRLVVITYHSLEDRLVKNYLKSDSFDGNLTKDLYGNIESSFTAINRKVIIPDESEITKNNRARSAKLRIAERN